MKSLKISFIEGTGKYCKYFLIEQGHKPVFGSQKEVSFIVDERFNEVMGSIENSVTVQEIIETLEKEHDITIFGTTFKYDEPFGQSSGYYGGGYLLIVEVSYRLC